MREIVTATGDVGGREALTDRGVEPQVADVTGDNGFLLQRLRNPEGVVDNGLLNRVHLRGRKTESVVQAFLDWYLTDQYRALSVFTHLRSPEDELNLTETSP